MEQRLFNKHWTPILLCDQLLILLVAVYDQWVYHPLQTWLSPLIERIPRVVTLGGKQVHVFTANGVTWARTTLVVPLALCLKGEYFISACMLVLFHDFLDHLDGIVAKVHRKKYGSIDDPLLGGFLDAFCDKIVNVSTLWTILLVTPYDALGFYQAISYVGVCSAIICYEAVIGAVRVQDYYMAYYSRALGTSKEAVQPNIAANMDGKLKEKLESLGLAFLCLSLMNSNPMDTWAGVVGIICFAISLRFAHGSLLHKLNARKPKKASKISHVSHTSFKMVPNPREAVAVEGRASIPSVASAPVLPSYESSDSDSTNSSDHEEGEGEKVDKVYSVGCFDLFHRGHVVLLKRMRKMGREVIIGVHSDESIIKLKNRVPIDNTEKRMANVKKYADQVFVISSTDPSPYIRCCVHLEPGQKGLYVRGDDMPQFPGRSVCEELMAIRLLPYTQGVSSTELRAQLLNGRNGVLNGALPMDAHTKED